VTGFWCYYAEFIFDLLLGVYERIRTLDWVYLEIVTGFMMLIPGALLSVVYIPLLYFHGFGFWGFGVLVALFFCSITLIVHAFYREEERGGVVSRRSIP